jgi:hypothetical protein
VFTLVLFGWLVWPLYMGYVTDEESIDPGGSARVGLLARDGVAQFDNFARYLAD